MAPWLFCCQSGIQVQDAVYGKECRNGGLSLLNIVIQLEIVMCWITMRVL